MLREAAEQEQGCHWLSSMWFGLLQCSDFSHEVVS